MDRAATAEVRRGYGGGLASGRQREKCRRGSWKKFTSCHRHWQTVPVLCANKSQPG